MPVVAGYCKNSCTMQITSKDNARLKQVRALLRSKKEREKTKNFVVEGVRSLNALREGEALPQYSLREVWASKKAPEGIQADYILSHELMESLSDCRTSQGVLGVVEYSQTPLMINEGKGNYLLLDRVMDPGNMGTLIRSCTAFGFDGLLLYGDCVELFNPKTVRSSMGSLPFCNVWKVGNDIFRTLEALKYNLIATKMHGGENLYSTPFGEKNVLVIGNEANGICTEIFKRANVEISIPMLGNVESLNAAIAGAICMSKMMS